MDRQLAHLPRELTQKLLTFARGGSPQLRTGQLGPLVRDSISLVSHEPGVECKIDIAPDLLPCDFDEIQIRQVLNNIVINAKQALGETGGKISVTARNLQPEDQGRDRIEILVSDNGCGISSDQMDRIFEPYYTTKEDGTGIGLATTYSIVKQHGGDVTVDSVLDQGTTFRIVLYAADAGTELASAPPKNDLGRQLSVLIVDDDPAVRKSLQAMMCSVGIESKVASDGESALDLYSECCASGESFDLVLIDLTIKGGLGGRKTMQRLLEIDPDVRGVVISGYSDDKVMSNYKDYGFVGRLQKPFSLDELQMLFLNLHLCLRTLLQQG